LVLQGTFETLSLPEVLGLLASARKTGALWLEAGPITGVAHLEDGHCLAAEAGEERGPVDDGTALLARLVDLCFAVMCQESGSFRFAADDPAPWSGADRVELSDVLVEVDRLLKQWREILRVIPSLECRPQLLESLQVEELVVDRERWALLVAMDGRRTVRELVQRTNRPVIELCQTLLEFIEAGAVGVIDPAAARVPEAETPPPDPAMADPAMADPAMADAAVADAAVTEPAVAASASTEPEAVEVATPVEVAGPSVETTEPAPGAVLTIVPESGARPAEAPEPERPAEPEPERQAEPEPEPVAAAGGSDAPDKGAFLRLFSGLRDS
jgi:Domain of unknown function (DUF4388)